MFLVGIGITFYTVPFLGEHHILTVSITHTCLRVLLVYKCFVLNHKTNVFQVYKNAAYKTWSSSTKYSFALSTRNSHFRKKPSLTWVLSFRNSLLQKVKTIASSSVCEIILKPHLFQSQDSVWRTLNVDTWVRRGLIKIFIIQIRI